MNLLTQRDGLPCWLVVGFSGHRQLHIPDQAVGKRIDKILNQLLVGRENTLLAGVSSAASGADTIFAETILKRRAQLAVILPFPAERFAKDFDDQPAGSWERAKRVVAAANHVDVVHRIEADLNEIVPITVEKPECGMPGDGIVDAPPSDQPPPLRKMAYLEATIQTVERCDVLLVVWDEQPGKGLGGTATAVRYAQKLGKPIVIYNPTKTTEPTIDFCLLPRAKAALPIDLSDPRQFVIDLESKLSEEAAAAKKIAAGRMKHFVYTHLIAATFGATVLIFGLFESISWVPGAAELVALMYGLYLIGTRGPAFQKWRNGRAIAEVCRTFLATWDIRRRPTLVHQPRAPMPGQADLFRRLRLIRGHDKSELKGFDETKQAYLKDRIDDQIKYFKIQLAIASRSFCAYSITSKSASFAAIAATIASFILAFTRFDHVATDIHEPSVAARILELAGIVLPLVVTAMALLMISQEASRRMGRYQEMIDVLQLCRPEIDAACTWDSLVRSITEVEEAMLQEIVEWRAFVEYTEHLH